MIKISELKHITFDADKLKIGSENNKSAHVANKAQELQYQRMKLGSFNNFDGELVGQNLQTHRDLWTAFIFG